MKTSVVHPLLMLVVSNAPSTNFKKRRRSIWILNMLNYIMYIYDLGVLCESTTKDTLKSTLRDTVIDTLRILRVTHSKRILSKICIC